MIIREEREKLGLKVYELAKMVGVDPVYVTRIEKHNRLPSIFVYLNIEKTLKLPHSLRAQYYKEKNPEVVKQWPAHEIDEVFNIGATNSIHSNPIIRSLQYVNNPDPKDVKSFIIGLIRDLNPDYTLSEKDIKEYTELLKGMAKDKAAAREKFKKYLKKLRNVNNVVIPNMGEGGPEYLKWGF